jgi:hypothetical protein
MGIHHDIEQGLKKYKITKIDGQPKDEGLNLLTKKLTNAAGSVTTQNGGGEHCHDGMVVNKGVCHFLQEWYKISGPNEPRTLPNYR